MKTLSEIYSEVMASEERKQEFIGLTTPEQVVGFVKKLGGDATAEEIAEFLTSQQTKSGELSDEEVTQVSGGNKGGDICSYGGTNNHQVIIDRIVC